MRSSSCASTKQKKMLKMKGMGIEVNYTAPDTPPQNCHVDLKFGTLFNQLCAMLNVWKFCAFLRNGTWPKAANNTTLFENNLITPNGDLSIFQSFLGREREAFCIWFKNLVNGVFSCTGITSISLSYIIKVYQAFGYILQMVIKLVPTVCTTQWPKKLFKQKMWLS